MAESDRYYVIRTEQLVSGVSFADEGEAIGHAVRKVQGDRDPRAVVRVVATHAADPMPLVITTRFSEEQPA